MKKNNVKIYALFILLTELTGIISGLIARSGIADFASTEKSPLTPPPIVFPIVWSILYLLMGIGIARVYLSQKTEKKKGSYLIFALQLIVNFFWSIFFFNRQAYGFTFFWTLLLLVLVAAMIFYFEKADKAAAYIQIPYLLWVTFAAYLAFSVWQLNK